jgi:hypothetical protein
MSSETPIIDELAETVPQEAVQSSNTQVETQDDNGYVDVHDLIRNEVEAAEAEAQAAAVVAAVAAATAQEVLVKPVEQSKVVVAEPDSSSDLVNRKAKKPSESQSDVKPASESSSGSSASCSKCPMRQSCAVTQGVCNLCKFKV